MLESRVGRSLLLIVLSVSGVARADGVPLQDAQSNPAASPQQGVALPSFAENDTIPEALRVQTFALVWETIRDRYFDPALGGVDWDAVRERYAASVREAETSGAFHDLLLRMLKELPGSHLAILAPHQRGMQAATSGPPLFAPEGLELRSLGGQIVVYAVAAGSPAEEVGLVPGEILVKVGDANAPSPDDVLRSPRRGTKTGTC